MSTQKFINISLLSWGCLFCIVAAVCMVLSKNFAKDKRKWMICMQTGAAILLGADVLAWTFRGMPGTVGFYMVRIANFLVFVNSDLVMLFFHRYLCVHLFSNEAQDQPVRVRAGEVICLVGVALVVLSQFTGFYYTFTAGNVYQRSNGYVLSVLIPFLTMMIDLSLLIQYRSRMKRKIIVSLANYILLALAALVLQTIWYGFSLNNIAIGISMVLLFVAAVGEQNEVMEQLSSREAMAMERLAIETMLNRCVKELSSDTDIDVSINNLLEIILDYFEADRTYIFECNFERDILVNTYEYVKGQVSKQLDNLQEVPIYVVNVWFKAFERDNFYYMADLEKEKGSDYYEILRMQDISRLLAVPLRKNDKIIGFLGVDNPRAHNEDPTLLSSLQYFVTNSLERKRKKEYLKAMSYQDMLTGLYNRNRYMEVIESEAARQFTCVGAAYIDLNGLKRMNDECGHDAGDEMIRKCAAVLSEIFPKKCYRIGGDEFVILTPNTKEGSFYEGIKQVRSKMQEQEISISLGALWKENPGDLACMLRAADERMYVEKEQYHRCMKN